MAVTKVFGEIPGIPEGQSFPSRQHLMAAGLHRAGQAGIVGNSADGAESVVISGGYEDDEDHGALIIYTGHGGKDPNSGRQIADQSLDAPGNAALVTSSLTGVPVRVIRGRNRDSSFAPTDGYRYDGLFRVESWWTEAGRSNFLMCRYRLVKVGTSDLLTGATAGAPSPAGTVAPDRRTATVQRVIRSSAVAEYVKRVHDHTCQFCSTRLSVNGRGYSEAAHIRPLGRPHDGPDLPENVLCLCPNCHVLFDFGQVFVDGHLTVTSTAGATTLNTHPKHTVDLDHLRYHRQHHGGT